MAVACVRYIKQCRIYVGVVPDSYEHIHGKEEHKEIQWKSMINTFRESEGSRPRD